MSEENAIINPRNNSCLLGHEKAEKDLFNAWKNNSLHNSWLISGVEGIGKATLAYRFARFLLNSTNSPAASGLEVSPDSQIFRLVANNSHPDLKIIERDFTDTDRKKVIKAINDGDPLSEGELKELKKSTFIRVDDVRTINDFLSRRSSNDSWRVVIIDSIDDMNSASANAVLKILEEPPYKAMMLLISHNPGRLLPTIKSRCAKLTLAPLAETTVASLLRRYRPQLTEAEVNNLASLSSGSIGKAIRYSDNDALRKYDRLCRLISSGSKFKIADMLDYCTEAVSDEENYLLVKELLLKFMADYAKNSKQVEELVDSWQNAIKVFDETDRLNLDKKQALINIITNLCKRI